MQLKSATGLLLLSLFGLTQNALGRVIQPRELANPDAVPSVCRGFGGSRNRLCVDSSVTGAVEKRVPCERICIDHPVAVAVEKRVPQGRGGRGGSNRGGDSDSDGGSPSRGGGSQRGGGQRGGDSSSNIKARFTGILDPEPAGLDPRKRAVLEEFDRWDRSRTPDERGENNHWLFYTQLNDGNRQEILNKFKNDFNRKDADGNVLQDARFRGDLGSPHGADSTEITTMPTKYSSFDIFMNRLNKDNQNTANDFEWIVDGMTSFAAARTAAQRGGDIRLLVPNNKKVDDNKSFFTNFEAYELTKPESKVTRILKYDGSDESSLGKPPTVIWEQGDTPIGQPADFGRGLKFP